MFSELRWSYFNSKVEEKNEYTISYKLQVKVTEKKAPQRFLSTEPFDILREVTGTVPLEKAESTNTPCL
jgi:hypothetical protein